MLYLGYASFFILRQMCPLCLTMYVAVVGLFAVSGAAASGLTTLPGRLGADLRNATLTDANLSGANMVATNLSDALMTGADTSGANMVNVTGP